jgi:hypothetical protein
MYRARLGEMAPHSSRDGATSRRHSVLLDIWSDHVGRHPAIKEGRAGQTGHDEEMYAEIHRR